MTAFYGDDLGGDHGHRLARAINGGVAGRDVIGSMILDHAQHVPAQKHAAATRYLVPSVGIQKIHLVSERKAEAAGLVAGLVMRLGLAKFGGNFVQWIGRQYFFGHTNWQAAGWFSVWFPTRHPHCDTSE